MSYMPVIAVMIPFSFCSTWSRWLMRVCRVSCLFCECFFHEKFLFPKNALIETGNIHIALAWLIFPCLISYS